MRYVCFILFLWKTTVHGQVYGQFRTAASLGQEVFGNNVKGTFCFFRNMAALPGCGNGMSAYAEKKFLMQDLQFLVAAASFRINKDGLGAWIGWQGTPMLSSFAGAIAFGKSLGKINAGLQLSYHALLQRGYGQRRTIQASAGMIWSLSSACKVTLLVDHFLPERSIVSAGNELRMEWGMGYQCSPEVMIWAQANKSVNFPLSWEGGIQYLIQDKLRISIGWKGQHFTPWIGLTWQWNPISISIYGAMHPVLGFTPGLHWGYRKVRVE